MYHAHWACVVATQWAWYIYVIGLAESIYNVYVLYEVHVHIQN